RGRFRAEGTFRRRARESPCARPPPRRRPPHLDGRRRPSPRTFLSKADRRVAGVPRVGGCSVPRMSRTALALVLLAALVAPLAAPPPPLQPRAPRGPRLPPPRRATPPRR